MARNQEKNYFANLKPSSCFEGVNVLVLVKWISRWERCDEYLSGLSETFDTDFSIRLSFLDHFLGTNSTFPKQQERFLMYYSKIKTG